MAIVPVAEPMGHAARNPLLLECAMPVFSIRVAIMIFGHMSNMNGNGRVSSLDVSCPSRHSTFLKDAWDSLNGSSAT